MRLPLFIYPLFVKEDLMMYDFTGVFMIFKNICVYTVLQLKHMTKQNILSDFSVFKCNLVFYFKVLL